MALVRKYFLHGLVVSVLLGAGFAFLGVYNTNNIPFFTRFVFWTSTMVVGIFTTGLITPWITNRLLPEQHIFIQLMVISILISMPVTLVLAGFDSDLAADWTVKIWFIQFNYVLAISVILLFGAYFIFKAQGLIDITEPQDDKAHSDPVEQPTSKLLGRLPASYRNAELYAVSSEDHYLRIYTNVGEELILMRLSDALRELEHVSGIQTHRSWWVALDAVEERKRSNGKQTLLLKSGISVPVSRTFDKAVKQMDFG